MNSVSLYSLSNSEIKISIDARFDGESLIIDGYDIGKKVAEYWGDSDYEYITTIAPENVVKLYQLFQIAEDKQLLLQALATRFNTNTCYSDIQKLLDEQKIPYESFSWT